MFFDVRDAARQRRFFLSLARSHERALVRAFAELTAGLSPGGEVSARRARHFERVLGNALRRAWAHSISETSRVFTSAAAMQKSEKQWEDLLTEYLGARAAVKVRGISNRAVLDVRRILVAAAADEKDGRWLNESAAGAALIRKFRRWSLVRGMRVARTETHAAANTASNALAAERGMQWKMWSAANQPGRTRPSHAAASGQVRKINKPFLVGGALLRFPGDPNAPVREIVNCRCVCVFRNLKGRKKPKP